MKRVYVKSSLVLLIGVMVVLIAGCGNDDGGTGPTIENNKLTLDLYNFRPLPAGWLFQLWVFKDNAWVAGSAFNLDASLDLIDPQGQPIAGNKITFETIDLTECDSARVTLQQTVATSPLGAGLTMLRTTLDSSVSFTMNSPLIDQVEGKDLYFIFATPTDDAPENDTSGVWFTDETMQEPGLDSLPDLPTGYIFEGWINVGDHYISTGKFTENSGADQGRKYYTNVADAPPFPGEDFLENAPSGVTFPLKPQIGDRVLISIETTDDPLPDSPFIPWYQKIMQVQPNPGFKWLLVAVGYDNWPKAVGFIVSD